MADPDAEGMPPVPAPVWTESVPARSWTEPVFTEPIAPPAPPHIVDVVPEEPSRRHRPLWPWVLAVVLVVAVAGTVVTVAAAFGGRHAAPDLPPLAAPQPLPVSASASAPAPSPSEGASGQASAAASNAPIAGPSGSTPAARASTATTKALPNGRIQLRLAHTGMCVGEGPELFKSTGRTVLGQHSCASASPPVILAPIAGTTVRIKLDSPDYGIGCATVDYGGTGDGLLLAGRPCDDARADQKFTLEAVSTGYRLHSVPGGGFCIGVYLASRDPGVQLIQTGCDGGGDQVFLL